MAVHVPLPTACVGPTHCFSAVNRVMWRAGWYWDVSAAFEPDTPAEVALQLPLPKAAAVAGLFFENTLTLATQQVQVEAEAEAEAAPA